MTSEHIGRCDVWALSRRGAVVEGELEVERAPRLAAQLADKAGTLRYRLTGLVDEQGRPAARLLVRGRLRARCDRCAGPVEVSIDEQAQFYFVDDERELERLPIDDSPEEPLLGSSRFDLASLIEEQAILALPISPRHAECAAPPPTGADRAPAGETHRPLEALAALKKQRR